MKYLMRSTQDHTTIIMKNMIEINVINSVDNSAQIIFNDTTYLII